MCKNAVICGIEHVLRNDGCNEIPISELYARVKVTRGNFSRRSDYFMTVLNELLADGLFERILEERQLTDASSIARSQQTLRCRFRWRLSCKSLAYNLTISRGA